MKARLNEKFSKHFHFFQPISCLVFLFAIFYWAAYLSVSNFPPSSIPVHHDDYTNYTLAYSKLSMAVRPVSSYGIYLLSKLGPDFLIWTVRILSVLYVYLCIAFYAELTSRRNLLLISLIAGVAIFSSPIVVEYARYTGLITHLISGCFGILSVILVKKAFDLNSLKISICGALLLVLSVLAKEDFLVFYCFALLYFGVQIVSSKKVKLAAFSGAVIAVLLLGALKIYSASAFLGSASANSSYFLNAWPSSIAKTMINYLSGAGHPAMALHGNIVILGAFIIGALLILKCLENASTIVFLIGMGLCIMLPYAVLPNHTNAYYDFLWFPFFVLASCLAIKSFRVPPLFLSSRNGGGYLLQIAVALAASGVVAYVDLSQRRSIAGWYDDRIKSNSLLFANLTKEVRAVPDANLVCIRNAGQFSPWYMHDGSYLYNILNLKNRWIINEPETSPLFSGFKLGADASAGHFLVGSNQASFNQRCDLSIDLAGKY